MDEVQIEEWKDQYGSIFSVGIRGKDYIFRSLTIAEHEKAVKLSERSMSSAEDMVITRCLLEPSLSAEDLGNLPAGTVSALAEEILDYSGWANPQYAKSVLDEEREKMEDLQYLIKALIISAMPAYKEEDLENMTFHQLFHKVALAEKAISTQQAAMMSESPIKIDLIDPQEEAEKQEQANNKAAATKKPGQAGPGDEIAQKLHQALG